MLRAKLPANDTRQTMTTNKTFWLGLVLFQIAFGSAVFIITRNIYIEESGAPVTDSLARSSSTNAQDELLNTLDNPFFKNEFPAFEVSENPAEVSRLANEAFANEDYAAAAELYRRLLTFDPQNVDVYNNLGLTLHYVGRSEEALEWLNQGVAINEENQRIWLTLGFVASQTGNTSTARDALNNAITKGSDESIRESARGMLESLP